MDGRTAEQRVWSSLPPEARRALETELAPTDLQTLLMAVARSRAQAVSPARVLRRWQEDRFVRPSTCDPRRLAPVEARLWELLPPSVAGVELSPLAPLGTCSALGPVDQHRMVSTVRGTEVLSDPTNALAIEAADRRLRQRDSRVDVAACARVVRAQRFAPGWSAHFPLFAMVSSARDTGSGRTEAQLLADHIEYWQRVLADWLPAGVPRITVTVFDQPVLAERLHDTVLPALAGGPVTVVEDPERTHGIGYYAGAAIGLRADFPGETMDLGDGGLIDWTAKMLGDRKERAMASCISTERLTAAITR